MTVAAMKRKPRFFGDKSSEELKAELFAVEPADNVVPMKAPALENDPSPQVPPSEAAQVQSPQPMEQLTQPAAPTQSGMPTPPPQVAMPAPPSVDLRYEEEIRRLRAEKDSALEQARNEFSEREKSLKAQLDSLSQERAEMLRSQRERELEDALALKDIPEIPGYDREDVAAIYAHLVKPALKSVIEKTTLEQEKMRQQFEKNNFITEDKLQTVLESRTREDRRNAVYSKVFSEHPDFPQLKGAHPGVWDNLLLQPIKTADGLSTSRTYVHEVEQALDRGTDRDIEFISGIIKVFKSRIGQSSEEASAAAQRLVEPSPVGAQTATIPSVAPAQQDTFTWDDVDVMDRAYREGRISKSERDEFLKRFQDAKAAGRVRP